MSTTEVSRRALVAALPVLATLPVAPPPACPSPSAVTSSTLTPLTDQESARILGVQANIWTEHIRTDARLEQMAFPRAAAVAESGWTAEEHRNWPSFVQA